MVFVLKKNGGTNYVYMGRYNKKCFFPASVALCVPELLKCIKTIVIAFIKPRLGENAVKEQLQKLYTPMIKIIRQPNMSCWIKLIKIKRICDDYPELCIPELTKEIEKVDVTKDVVATYSIVEKTIIANWNWAKKTLEYPYDEGAIDEKCLYENDKRVRRRKSMTRVLRKCMISYYCLLIAFVVCTVAAIWFKWNNTLAYLLISVVIYILIPALGIPTILYYVFCTSPKKEKKQDAATKTE